MTNSPFLGAARGQRYYEAYLLMAEKADYRPQAPGDGMGHVSLSQAELADPARLAKEAAAYAVQFNEEESTRRFNIGCSSYSDTNRAFIMTIEAARALAGGMNSLALDLLTMASTEVRGAKSRRNNGNGR